MRTWRQRCCSPVITPPREGRESVTIFPLWVRLSTLTLDECINLPLQVNDHYLDRKGDLAGTIQINKRDGKLYFGLVSDMTSNFAGSRKAYSPKCEEVVLDWGIRTLFSTDSGDLLGRGFIDHLKYLDSLITSLASYRQEHGLRVRSAKYDDYVERMRGYVRSEVGRVLNRLVEIHRPGRIVVESLDFRHPELSRRMNRLLSISGRAIVEKKLSVLSERYGIEVVRVPAAYSSQECSSCGYVDAKNRKGEVFECRWCAMKMHADVNAPRALKARRTRTFLVAPGEGEWARGTSRKSILYTLVHEFQMRSGVERSKQGRRGTSCNPRMSNPYFREWKRGESSSVILNGIGVHRDSSGESCASKQ